MKTYTKEELAVVLEKHTKWWPGTCELTTFLCGIVRSKLWNLAKSEEARTTQRETEFESISGSDGATEPDKAAEVKDDFDLAIALLSEHPRVKGKSDHELMITALGCGALEPDEIERETGLQRSRIYQIQRELADIYPDIRKQLQTKKGACL